MAQLRPDLISADTLPDQRAFFDQRRGGDLKDAFQFVSADVVIQQRFDFVKKRGIAFAGKLEEPPAIVWRNLQRFAKHLLRALPWGLLQNLYPSKRYQKVIVVRPAFPYVKRHDAHERRLSCF